MYAIMLYLSTIRYEPRPYRTSSDWYSTLTFLLLAHSSEKTHRLVSIISVLLPLPTIGFAPASLVAVSERDWLVRSRMMLLGHTSSELLDLKVAAAAESIQAD